MKWSWRIGEFRGIGVYLHFTFLILVAVIGLWSFGQQSNLTAAVEAVFFLLTLFACVVLHEFGHALMAQKHGIPTRDITLLPIGGVARLERMPDDPRQELSVALAGPAVNVVIAAGLFALLTITGSWTPLSELTMANGSILQRLLIANVTLIVFNMLPAFPLDGGRVLRSVLAMRTDYARATRIAAWAGQGMAVIFGLIGLLANPMLVFIAIFVWIGAQQEARAAQVRSSLNGIPVSDWMSRRFRTVSPDDTLHGTAQLLLSGTDMELPVVEDGSLRGFVDRPSVFRALRSMHPATPLRDVMRPGFAVVCSDDSLAGAYQKMLRSQTRTAPVLDGSYLVGLLHIENLVQLASFGRLPNPALNGRRSTLPSTP